MKILGMMYRIAQLSQLLLLFGLLAIPGCDHSTSPSDYYYSSKVVLERYPSLDSIPWPTGTYQVDTARIEGDLLYMTVSCAARGSDDITLLGWNFWLESSPVQVGSILSFPHASAAATIRTFKLAFNLSPIKEAFRRDYRNSGSVVIDISGYPDPYERLEYSF